MDDQKEKCKFYQAILHFNGKIKEDLIKNVKMHSCCIMSLKDLKNELIKKLNRFFFINNSKSSNSYSEFSLASQIITIYPYTFAKDEDFISKQRRISSITLFLIFHEICGHLKTNMNSNKPKIMTTSHHFDNNLNLINTNFKENDSRYIFEIILIDNFIEPHAMMESQKTEDLFDIKYYIQSDFIDLKNKIKEIVPIKFEKSCIEYMDQKKSINQSEEKDSQMKLYEKFPKSFIEKLKEIEKNLEIYNYNSLFPIFLVPRNMSREEFDDLLKDNIVYKKFIKILPNEDVKY